MRRENDFYPTPEWATEELLKHVPIDSAILECCAGNGDMAKVLALSNLGDVFCNDLNPETIWPNHWDATDPNAWRNYGDVDWVVTNPPFNAAAEIVPLAYRHVRRGIAMLLRLSYLEPVQNRGLWLNQHAPTKLIVLPRISFTGDGKTDNVTCAWIVWEKAVFAQTKIIIAENPRFTTTAQQNEGLFATA